MTDLRLALVVEAVDQFSSTFGRMGATVQSRLSQMRQNIGGFADALERVGGRAAGIAASIGAGFEAKRVIDELDMFRRLGIDAGVSADRVEELKERIFSVARESRVPLDELTAGFKEMFDRTDLDASERSVDALAASIQRLGDGSGQALGVLFGSLEMLGDAKGPQELIRSMAVLREQVGSHAEWLTEFAKVAPELLQLEHQQGITGMNALRDVGALYATMRPVEVRGVTTETDIRSILDIVNDPSKAMQLQGLGIHVLGNTAQEMNANYLTGHRAPIRDYLPEMIKAYQDPAISLILSQLLGPTVRDALSKIKPEDLQRAFAAQGDPAKFLDEQRKAAQSTKAALNELYTTVEQLSDSFLAPPLHFLTMALNAFPRLTAQAIMALGGLAIAGAATGWIRNLREAFAGAGAEAVRTAGAIKQVSAATEAAAAADAARSTAGAAASRLARGVGLRGLFFADLLWNAKDTVDRYAAENEAARKKFANDPAGFAAWEKARAAKVQKNFADNISEWTPGLHNVDLTKQLPWTGLGPKAWHWLTGSGSDKTAKADITVRFQDAPKGMRVKRTDSDPGTRVNLDTGYGMAVP